MLLLKISFVRTGFLTKIDDKKIMCLSYCSLMNCTILLEEVKREVFLGINRSTFCFEK